MFVLSFNLDRYFQLKKKLFFYLISSKKSIVSLMYTLNEIGDNEHPCFKLIRVKILPDILLSILTTKPTELYIPTINVEKLTGGPISEVA